LEFATSLVPFAGCSEPPRSEGTLRVTVYGEAFVEDGIPAAEVVDGWAIDFTALLVAIDGIAADEVVAEHPQAIFDLTLDSAGEGHQLTELTVARGRVEHLHYRIGPAVDAVAGNATAAQVEHMNQGGLGIWAEGVAH